MQGVVLLRHLPAIRREFGWRIGYRCLWAAMVAWALRRPMPTFLSVLRGRGLPGA